MGDHVVDALPASRITGQTWGGGMSLRFEPSLIEATVDGPSPCVGCGGELPPFRGVQRCGFCGRTFYAILSCGRRFLVGFHVEGDDEGSAVDGWVPIGEAVEHYAARRELASRSNKSTFKAIGLWLILGPLVIAGLFGCGCIFLGFGTALLPPEYVGLIPMLAFAGFGLGALLLFALFGALVFSRVVKHRRDRAEITRGLAPLAVKGIPPRG